MTASLFLCADGGSNATALARIDDQELVTDAIRYSLGEARRKAETAESAHLRAIYQHSAESLRMQLQELVPSLEL
jgi:hypothetical protein